LKHHTLIDIRFKSSQEILGTMRQLNKFNPLGFTFLILAVLSTFVHGLKVMELMAPYRIRSEANDGFLTSVERGIIGLTTGPVITAPHEDRYREAQQWTLAWDPSMDDNHNGYRIESRHEYLNQVTAYYPDGRTKAMPNIWEIIELPEGIRILKNKRSQKCLQVTKYSIEVAERTCSYKNRFQHWRLEQLNLDKRL